MTNNYSRQPDIKIIYNGVHLTGLLEFDLHENIDHHGIMAVLKLESFNLNLTNTFIVGKKIKISFNSFETNPPSPECVLELIISNIPTITNDDTSLKQTWVLELSDEWTYKANINKPNTDIATNDNDKIIAIENNITVEILQRAGIIDFDTDYFCGNHIIEYIIKKLSSNTMFLFDDSKRYDSLQQYTSYTLDKNMNFIQNINVILSEMTYKKNAKQNRSIDDSWAYILYTEIIKRNNVNSKLYIVLKPINEIISKHNNLENISIITQRSTQGPYSPSNILDHKIYSSNSQESYKKFNYIVTGIEENGEGSYSDKINVINWYSVNNENIKEYDSLCGSILEIVPENIVNDNLASLIENTNRKNYERKEIKNNDKQTLIKENQIYRLANIARNMSMNLISQKRMEVMTPGQTSRKNVGKLIKVSLKTSENFGTKENEGLSGFWLIKKTRHFFSFEDDNLTYRVINIICRTGLEPNTYTPKIYIDLTKKEYGALQKNFEKSKWIKISVNALSIFDEIAKDHKKIVDTENIIQVFDYDRWKKDIEGKVLFDIPYPLEQRKDKTYTYVETKKYSNVFIEIQNNKDIRENELTFKAKSELSSYNKVK